MEYRSRRGNQLSIGRGWQDSEKTLLEQMAGRTKAKIIARSLNRSYESVRQMAKRLGLSLLCK